MPPKSDMPLLHSLAASHQSRTAPARSGASIDALSPGVLRKDLTMPSVTLTTPDAITESHALSVVRTCPLLITRGW